MVLVIYGYISPKEMIRAVKWRWHWDADFSKEPKKVRYCCHQKHGSIRCGVYCVFMLEVAPWLLACWHVSIVFLSKASHGELMWFGKAHGYLYGPDSRQIHFNWLWRQIITRKISSKITYQNFLNRKWCEYIVSWAEVGKSLQSWLVCLLGRGSYALFTKVLNNWIQHGEIHGSRHRHSNPGGRGEGPKWFLCLGCKKIKYSNRMVKYCNWAVMGKIGLRIDLKSVIFLWGACPPDPIVE